MTLDDTGFEILRRKVIESTEISESIDDDEVYDAIDRVIMGNSVKSTMGIMTRIRLRERLYNSIRGLDVLEDIIYDDSVTEIMINGADNIFVEKDGKITKYDERFSSTERLMDVIQKIVSGANRRVNEASPIVDTRLEDGSRVNVVLNPIALDGPVLTIRKFPSDAIDMDRLIEFGSIDEDTAMWLRKIVAAGYNVFISGGTGSGKTTFLNALSNYIPGDERIITIEDSAELQIKNVDNLVRLEVRQENSEGENGISMRELIKSALRMRPDRIIVGEVRGEEAIDMIQAMNTGHDGSISTGHANSPSDMLLRLETMILMGVDMPVQAIRGQIAAAIDIVIHLGRLRDKSRKVLEIIEVLGMEDGCIRTQTLYKFVEDGVRDEHIIGHLERSDNEMVNTWKMEAAGI